MPSSSPTKKPHGQYPGGVGSRCSGEGRTGLRHPVCRWLQYGYSLLGICLWSVVFGWALFIICRLCSIYDIRFWRLTGFAASMFNGTLMKAFWRLKGVNAGTIYSTMACLFRRKPRYHRRLRHLETGFHRPVLSHGRRSLKLGVMTLGSDATAGVGGFAHSG